MTEKQEICPVCAENGINELREVTTEEIEGKVVKTYSPCGHKSVMVTVEDKIALKDEAKVNKHVIVTDEFKLRDSVSVAKKVLQGYELLSGTFNVNQANIAQKFNLEENIKQLVVFTQIIHGDVYGNVTQAVGSRINFSQQVSDAFKQAYNIVEVREDVPADQKEEIRKNLKVLEEELQSKEADAGKIQKSWRWLKQNASWVIPTLTQVVIEGTKNILGI